MNGQVATFQSGGQFPVPVIGGFGAIGGVQGVQFVPFGVQISFTPIITDRDRIRLTVQAVVSTRDNAASANIGGANVPGLNTRSFSTTVELREGQTMAVALAAESNVDRSAQWTDLSVSDRNVVSALDGSPYTQPGPPNSHPHFDYEVAVFRANQPGETTISAIYRGCAASLGCDRGIRWWVTIEVRSAGSSAVRAL